MKIDPTTLPLISLISGLAVQILQNDPVYRRLCEAEDATTISIPMSRIALHVNVAVGLVQMAADRIGTSSVAAIDGNLGALAAAAMSRRQ